MNRAQRRKLYRSQRPERKEARRAFNKKFLEDKLAKAAQDELQTSGS